MLSTVKIILIGSYFPEVHFYFFFILWLQSAKFINSAYELQYLPRPSRMPLAIVYV